MATVPFNPLIPLPVAPAKQASAPAAAKAPSNNGTYWVGANGLVYVSGGNGVNSAGKADANTNGYWTSRGFSQIADPNAPKAAAPPGPSDPNGTGGSGSGTTYADKSNDIALQNAGLAAVDQRTNTGLAAIDKAFSGIIGQYDTEAATNEQNYGTQSDTNQNNLQTNKQTALTNAAAGLQGLRGKLASLGAFNGSGIKLSNQAVQKGANDDLSGAEGNYDTNQTGLDTSINTFRQQDKQRRDNAATARDDAKTAAQNQAAKDRQTYLSNLSNDYSAQGDASTARSFSDQAAALFPELAKTSVPSTNLAYSGAAYTPATLSSYLTGQNPTSVSSTAANGTSLPGLVATTGQKKKQTA